MLKFMHLAHTLLDVNLYESEWWHQTARYAQYLSLPRQAWTRANCIVDVADSPRSHWYGPDYLLRGLATVFHDGHAQWLAQQVDDAKVAATGASWLNLVWFDPTVTPLPPGDLPTLRHFEDLGLVSARSDWSGAESLVVFKCGPFIGHRAVRDFSYDPGGGHVHPDANHFVLFAGGEWLIRDDGYRAKWTGQHNTLLVDGQGQLGEGEMWFNGTQALRVKSRPRILCAESNPACDHIAGDATDAYPRALGLRRYVRHVIFLKPDALLVCDDIVLDRPRALELRFHPESLLATRDAQAFVFQTKQSTMRLDLLTPDHVTFSAEEIAAADRHGDDTGKLFTVRLAQKAEVWRNVVALTWCSAGHQPDKVAIESQGDVWRFSLGSRTAKLDWRAGEETAAPGATKP
jgi:Heparinase II/III-like protein